MRQPGPEETVHVLNRVYRQLDSGGWEAWIEPLGGGEPRFHVEGASADEARQLLDAEMWAAFPEGGELWQEFLGAHSRAMVRRDVLDAPWPPVTKEWRRLDLVEEAQRRASTLSN